MKSNTAFYIIFLVVTTVGFGLFIHDYIFAEDEIFMDEIQNHLTNITIERLSLIENSLDKMELDSIELAKSDDVKNLFNQKFVSNEDAAKFDAEYMAKLISSEIERYMLVNPNITLNELKNSSAFYRLSVRPVGKSGHSLIINSNDQSILIGESENLEKPNENEKYVYSRPIKTKTFDGTELAVQVVGYINDYLTISDNYDINLEKYHDLFDYNNLLLISPDGQIVYMLNREGGYGTNLNWNSNLDSDLHANYLDSSDVNNTVFRGPFRGYYGDIFYRISAMSKVYDGDEFVGIVTLISPMRKMDFILKEGYSFGESEESFLINNEKSLITPTTSFRSEMLSQQIKTENTQKCIKNLERGNTSTESKSLVPFLDYSGNLIYGVGIPIMKINWCILTEISRNEILEISRDKDSNKDFIFTLKAILLLILINFSIKIFFHKIHFFEESANFEKNKLRNRLFFMGLFILTYCLVIITFLGGLKNINFFNFIPDLLFMVVMFFILFYSSSSKDDKFKKFIFIGSLFFIAGKLISIPLYGAEFESTKILVLLGMLISPLAAFFGSIYYILGLRRTLK